MRYHNITKDDMLNGDGLRVVLWLAGCEHHCKGCQNPITWDPNGGLIFDNDAWLEIETELKKDYIDGITFSGGDPLHPDNVAYVYSLICNINRMFPDKTIWLYTGYTWEEVVNEDDFDAIRYTAIANTDVLVDGKYIEKLRDVTYPWAGSTNQRIIDVQKSLEAGCAIRWVGNDSTWEGSNHISYHARCECDS